jgi:hypothetical protein
MRCLRQITDIQQKANIFLSKDNYDILDAELRKNFNVEINDIFNKSKTVKKIYQVRMQPPPRILRIKAVTHNYSIVNKKLITPIDFGLKTLDTSRYEARIFQKDSIARERGMNIISGEEYKETINYSSISLVAEVARYMNEQCLKIEKILENSVDGIETIINMASKYNPLLYDVIIPKLFHALYEITSSSSTQERELILLRKPNTPDRDYYEFSADPDLVVKETEAKYKTVKSKSFHADTYCFDSTPEKECFRQYIFSNKVKEIYFTGMFTSKQGDLAIQYIDPLTNQLRNYYPDFVAKLDDNTWEIIEVKGDNMIDNIVVQAKKAAAQEMAHESNIDYKMYRGNFILKHDILMEEDKAGSAYDLTKDGYGGIMAADPQD